MDENKHEDDQSTTDSSQTIGQASPAGRQVMDVTAPTRQIDVAEDSSDQTASAPSATTETPEDTVPNYSETQQESSGTSGTESSYPTEEPENTASSEETSATNISVSDSGTDQPASATSSQVPDTDLPAAMTHEASATPPQKHAKSGAPMFAIVIAVIVALGLAGAVVFAYMKNKDNGDIKRDDSASSSQTVVEKPQASASDVDSTSKEIDSSLEKADDTKDFSTTELSDSTLGL